MSVPVPPPPVPAPPPIDGRDYRALLAEVLARIPVHTPEWTNRNDADPGITLLQLWASLAESVIYRSSLLPERNRQAFLRLVGYQRAPAQAAAGMVAFEHRSGPVAPHVLPPGTEVTAGAVQFRTDNGLDVLPVTSKLFLKRRAELTAAELEEVEGEYHLAGFAPPGTPAAYYETTEVDLSLTEHDPVDLATTVDGTMWVALLSRPGEQPGTTRAALAHRTLTLGIVPDLAADGRVLPPVGTPTGAAPRLEFALPNAAVPLPEDPAARLATYVPLPATASADVLSTAGVVQLELPGAAGLGLWALDPTEDGVGAFPPALEGADADRLVTWLRIRPAVDEAAGAAPAARLRWAGVNAATVRQRARVPAESLGRGTGRPDQVLHLANLPVLPDSLVLTVAGRAWQRVDDLGGAAPEVPMAHGSTTTLADPVERVDVYTVDRHTGEIRFGDGLHGRRPPAGAVVVAAYDHGGGRRGNVAAGAIGKGPALPTGVVVHNPVPTWGGVEAETVESAELAVSGHVRHRDRLVTAQDVADVARATPGVDLGRVEVVPLLHPALVGVASPGVLTVLVVPRFDARRPLTPEPDRMVLEAVCAHLDPRRLVTTEVHVRGPQYVPVCLSVGVEPVPGRDVAVVRNAVVRTLQDHFSPLHGGPAGTGWPLGTEVDRLAAWAVAARAPGVAKVTGVLLAPADGVDTDRVAMTGLQLPRLTLAVRPGAPAALAEVLGQAPGAAEPPAAVPVPYVPAEC